MKRATAVFLSLLLLPSPLWSQTEPSKFDVLIVNGTIYDGTGRAPVLAHVDIKGNWIAAIGKLEQEQARTVVDARGVAVAPGFINMLSWAVVSLLPDGRSQSEIRQSVTTEIVDAYVE